MVNQLKVFHDIEHNEYFLVEIYEDKIMLKVKRHGWSDTWSLPLDEVRGPK